MAASRVLGLALLCVALAAAEIKDKGWWKNGVVYQVFVRSFKDSNVGQGVGNLKGLQDKLTHFKDLGVDIIVLSSVYTSEMIDEGYDVSDYQDIDKSYGKIEDFENFIKEAHKQNIKVILDFVPNHTSDKHYWFTRSKSDNPGKYEDYYIWKESKGKEKNEPYNNWLSVYSGSAWTLDSGRKKLYLHQFDKTEPDLNFNKPEVRQEIQGILKYWLDKDVDGFQISSAAHLYEDDQFADEAKTNIGDAKKDYEALDHSKTKNDPRNCELLAEWSRFLNEWAEKNNKTERILLAAGDTDTKNAQKFYNCSVHMPLNYNFITNINLNSTSEDYKKIINEWIAGTPLNVTANWVISTQDYKRVATRLPGKADQIAMLSMILPGNPVIYYGDEIGMLDNGSLACKDSKDPKGTIQGDKCLQYSRDPARTPFQWDATNDHAGFCSSGEPWLPIHSNYKEVNLADQQKKENSTYNLYKGLISLRNNSQILVNGSLQIDSTSNNTVLSVARKHGEELVILLINLSNEKQVVNIESHIPGASSANVYVSSAGSNITWNSAVNPSSVTLPPSASVVITGRNNAAFLAASIGVLLISTFASLLRLM